MKFSRRTFLKLSLLGTIFTPPLSAAYARFVEPAWVDIENVKLTLPRLHPAFDSYRIVQISDIHLDTWLGINRLREVIQMVNEQKPDLVAITGDFISAHLQPYYADYVKTLLEISAWDGVVAVLGNHDHWMDAPSVRRLLQDAAIRHISNDVFTLRRENALLHIAGVDDIWAQQHRLDLVLDKLPNEGAAILLAHEPDFADESAKTGRFDLQLSGHSHGGQIRLPLFGAPVLPYLGVKYPMGLYRVGNMLQYTNRGIGMIRPPVRFNCRPEITVFTLSTQ